MLRRQDRHPCMGHLPFVKVTVVKKKRKRLLVWVDCRSSSDTTPAGCTAASRSRSQSSTTSASCSRAATYPPS